MEMTEEELAVAEQEMEEDAATADRGAWAGSWVCQDDLDCLYRTRRIPEGVTTCLAATDLAPSPNPGEYVVFLSHFQRGFGLPVSDFFHDWLNTDELQPHYLPANAITSLSAFASTIEGYAGLWPMKELWNRFFGLHRNVIPNIQLDPEDKQLTQFGAASISPRKQSIFS